MTSPDRPSKEPILTSTAKLVYIELALRSFPGIGILEKTPQMVSSDASSRRTLIELGSSATSLLKHEGPSTDVLS